MATSGSFDYQATTTNIIQEALEQTGTLRAGQTIPASLYVSCLRTLNNMVKAWQSDNIMLWTVIERFYSLTASSEVIGSDGVDYKCINPHDGAALTAPVTGAEYAGYWHELATTAGGAHDATGATSYVSLNHIDLEDDVLDVIDGSFIRDSEVDHPLVTLTRHEWGDKQHKSEDESQRPRNVFFTRGRDNPAIKLWPWPDATTYLLGLQIVRKLEDFDAALNNPDTTVKYTDAMTWGLSYRLCPKAGVSGDKLRTIKNLAEGSYLTIAGDDNEGGSMSVQPDFGR